MSLNSTTIMITSTEVSNTVVVLNILLQRFVVHLPLIFVILGLIGFVGNAFTFLQPELRSNTCCIYSFCGSIVDAINLLFNLLPISLGGVYGIYIPWTILPNLCKYNIFMLGFLPHLSINFLLMSIIDRYACTCSLTSIIHRLNQIKMVPWLICITIISSCLASLLSLILYEYKSGFGCVPTQPLTNSILYIIINGVMQPVTMFVFVLLTLRNVRRSRQRVGGTVTVNQNRSRNQFITTIFTQVIATAFISLQWMIMYTYYSIPANGIRTSEQLSIIFFGFFLTNICHYLNNVKSFYVSILTSRLFRQTFIKALIKLLPRHLRQRWQAPQINIPMVTATQINRKYITPRVMTTVC